MIRHDLCRLPWPIAGRGFDQVLAIDVLEHLPWVGVEDQELLPRVMREIHRVLKPGGILYVEVPHIASPIAVGTPGHQRFFNERTLLHFAQGRGPCGYEGQRRLAIFDSVEIRTTRRFPLHWFVQKRFPRAYRATCSLRLGARDKICATFRKAL